MTANPMHDDGHFGYALAANYRNREKEHRFNQLHLMSVLPRLSEGALDDEAAAPALLREIPAPSEPYAPPGDAVVAQGDHLSFDEISPAREAAFASLLLSGCQAIFPSLIEALDRRDVLIEMLDAYQQPGAGRSQNLRERRYRAEQDVLEVLHVWQQADAARRLHEAAQALRAAGGDPRAILCEMPPRARR